MEAEEQDRLTLLYVEDELETREIIAEALAAEFPDVVLISAGDGAEGLALFRERRPEVVLTDIKMPVMDGIRMAGEITAIDAGIELIALTAYSDTEFLLNAIEAGFSHYVLKPVEYETLFRAVRKSFDTVRLKRQVKEQNEQIRQLAAEQGEKVEERTAELQASRAELERKNCKLWKATHDLKAARDRYWNLYNWSPLGYLSLDNDFVIREINITGAQMLGTRRTELLEKSIRTYLSDENVARLSDAFEKCTSEDHVHLEVQLTVQEKKCLYVLLHCEPYRLHGLDVDLYRTAMTDITNIKQTEEKLHRLNRLYAMLSGTGKAIVHASGRDELFRAICRVSVEEGGFVQACIGMADLSNNVVEQVAVAWREGDEGADQCICKGHRLNDPGPVLGAIRASSYYVSNDSRSDPDANYCVNFSRFRSTAAFSLTIRGEGVGAFSISAGQVNYFDPETVDLLQQMARDISYALESMEKERLRRETEEALYRETAEKLKAVEELRRNERLMIQQNRLAAMGEMIGNIAHQWRQPLNVLGLMVQRLTLATELGDLDEGLIHETVGKAMEVITHLSGTIDDFRTFQQPDKEMRPFRVSEVVRATVSLVEAGFREQNIAIQLEMEKNAAGGGLPEPVFPGDT